MKEVIQTPANAEIGAEITAQADSLSGFTKTSGAIGALGLAILAQKLGESTNKSGRPSLGAWLAFNMAIVSSKPSFAVQNGAAHIANKHVPTEHVKKDGSRVQVAVMKAKGEMGGASCSFRINKPVAWELAVS